MRPRRRGTRSGPRPRPSPRRPASAGYASMATENTGGWQLTTSTYAMGGRMQEVGEDGKVQATVNNSATKAVLERLKAMRWEDNSMGSTFDYAWGTMNQAFAAGQVGMFTGGSDLYTWMIQNASLQPGRLRRDGHPARRLAGRRRAGRRHARRGQRRDHRGRARRGRQVDRLLLHPEAASPRRAPSPTRRPSPPTTSPSACPPCRSSTRPRTTSPRCGSRTTSTSRSPR